MRIETYQCDVVGCNSRTVDKNKSGWLIITFSLIARKLHINAADVLTEEGDDYDVCGAACAQKKLSELLPRLS